MHIIANAVYIFYSYPSKRGGQSDTVNCGKEEHTHSDECYEKVLTCTIEDEEHVHTDECYTSSLTCTKEEHTHTEVCYEEIKQISNENETSSTDSELTTLTEQGEIMSAQDLLEACNKATDGATLKLGANITYDQSELGTIVISKTISIDCNNYKISVDDALFEIASTGNLTLVNAQIETTEDDFIDTINAGGVLTITSTAGDGIVTSDDFIEYNYGKVNIKNGVFHLGYSLVFECYGNAEVVIENADIKEGTYIVKYLEDANCSLKIKKGSYTVDSSIIYSIYDGNILIENGNFHSDDDCFDSIYSGNLTIKNGEFTVGNKDNKSVCFYLDKSSSQKAPSATVNIEGGTFNSTDNAFYATTDAVINISGGIFTSDNYVIEASNGTTFNLSGGTFTNNSGDKAIALEADATVNIVDGYFVSPTDWNETNASKVEVSPCEYDIVFFDTNGTELYRETVKTKNTVVNWPAQPTSPGEDYRWWGWVDADGTRYDSDYVFTSSKELYAKFVNEGLPIDPDEPDEPSIEETIVNSYDELKDALEAKKSNIRISSDITFPKENGTLTISSNVYITADENTHIYGFDDDIFEVNSDVTVTVEGMNIDIGEGNIFSLNPRSICNIISGRYLANDDVIYGYGYDEPTVNLYGGYIEEKTGKDGPILNSNVVYKNHTKDGNEDARIINVVHLQSFTVKFYDGEEILKNVQIYEDEILSLPKMSDDSFLGWFDGDGTQYHTGDYINDDLTLFAIYKTEVVTVTFVVDGVEHVSKAKNGTALSKVDGFSLAEAWLDENGLSWSASTIVESNIVLYAADSDSIIKTLDEFKTAIASTNKSLIIGAEIPVTETVIVNRSVNISSIDGGSLVRADGFEDELLKIESEEDSISEVTIGNLLIDGNSIEANAPAISVDSASTLILRGATIRNNFNMHYNRAGGAVYSKGKVYMYDGTTLCNNKAYNGGAIEIDCDYKMIAGLYLYGGDICHNIAWMRSDCEGAGGGVHIAKNDNQDYVAFYMYGGRIHHNQAVSLDGEESDGIHGGGVSLTCGDDGIHFVMYDGEITDNYAAGNGGAVYTGCSSMAMYGGVMARNVAEGNGGAVSTDCCHNTFFMYGGTITLNVARISGGGVDSTAGDPYTLLGNVYGNLAGENGDDVYANDSDYGAILRKVNDSISYENPYYIADEMQTLYKTLVSSRPDYRIFSPIEGYDLTDSDKLMKLQQIGWYEDKEDKRYVEGDSPILITNVVDKTSFKLDEEQDVKAVYGGLLLVYDANYGTNEYQYDSSCYNYGTKATTQQNMFNREGYKFVGWNTKADGSGAWYYPDFNGYNKIVMDSNKVVYAQWVKIPEFGNLTVSKVVAGEGGETNKDFTITVTLDDITVSGIYGDMNFTKGVATFTLKHNEEKTATSLPAGINYEVNEIEANQNGYTTTVTNATGSIEKDKTISVVFTNTKKNEEPDKPDEPEETGYGNLIISKTVSGNAGDTTKAFTFTIELDQALNGKYGEVTFENGIAIVHLKHGEKVTATELPVGINYKVTESDNDGYIVRSVGANGIIEDGKTLIAAFTNTKENKPLEPDTDKDKGKDSNTSTNTSTNKSVVEYMLVRTSVDKD